VSLKKYAYCVPAAKGTRWVYNTAVIQGDIINDIYEIRVKLDTLRVPKIVDIYFYNNFVNFSKASGKRILCY